MDFDRRLSSLRGRRTGDRVRVMNESLGSSSIYKGMAFDSALENFEMLTEPKSVKYTVGAMSAVAKRSTEISIEEGLRVAESLIKSLEGKGEKTIAKIQGSVALDIHIEKYSDVDVLIINRETVALETPILSTTRYCEPTDKRALIDILKDIRVKSESILPVNFPATKVDCSKAKAIAVTGGSLRREVDIVPAMWYDNLTYQNTQADSDRGVLIYDKAKHESIYNLPFTHIKNMNVRDRMYSGNLKCVIRLMKTLIADMDDEKKAKVERLSSYDLAAIGYSMGERLVAPIYLRLSLVDKLRVYLLELFAKEPMRKAVKTPNDLGYVFEDDSKLEALAVLWVEVFELSEAIFKELSPYADKYNPRALEDKVIIFDSWHP